MKDISLQALVRALREEIDLPGDQEKIDVAEPKGKITAADLKKLRSMKKSGSVKEGEDINWPKEISSRYRDEFLFIHDDNKPGFYNVKDVQTGKIVDRYGFRTPKSAIDFAQNKVKPLGGRQSSQFESSLYEGPDHEVAMAVSSLKEIVSNATQLMQKLGTMERNIPGWIQDHITNAENYIEQANQGFHEVE